VADVEQESILRAKVGIVDLMYWERSPKRETEDQIEVLKIRSETT